eukprot:PITA_19254
MEVRDLPIYDGLTKVDTFLTRFERELSYTLECYNVNTEEDNKDPQKVNIPRTEGHRDVQGPLIKDLDITTPIKEKQLNIGIEVEPKYAMLGDYWDDAAVGKVVKLLRQYQDLFLTKIMDLKGIIEDLGMMRITLKPDVKLVKQRPYHLNPKYKEKVHVELDKILTARIIEPVEESD